MVQAVKPVIKTMVNTHNNGARNCKLQVKMINYNSHCTLKNEYLSDISISENSGGIEMEQLVLTEKKSYEKRGNPFKRGKTWTYIYYVTDPITLKKKQKTKGGFKTKKEAEEDLKNTESQIVTGAYVDNKKITLKEYLTEWIDIHKNNIATNTLNGYLVNINNHIIPCIGHVQLYRLSKTDINYLLGQLVEKGLSQTTIKYVRNVLRKALNDAEGEDLIHKNPCSFVPLPKQNKSDFVATRLDVAQAQELLTTAQGSGIELEILLALSLGLRRGEVLGLKFSDFNFTESEVHIRRQLTFIRDNSDNPQVAPQSELEDVWGFKDLKTKRSNRVLSVPQPVLDAVIRRKKLYLINKIRYGSAFNDTDIVCCNEDGSYRSPQTVYHAFKDILKKAGLPSMRFHDLRHSCATILLNAGVPLEVISAMLGHSTLGTTANIYCEITKRRKQTAQTMETVLFAQNG